MKVTVDGVEILNINDTKKRVMQHNIPAEQFDADMKRRLEWVIMHKYERSFKALKEEWDSKLAANGVAMIPTDPDAYAELVFSQPNYKDRSAREAELALKL